MGPSTVKTAMAQYVNHLNQMGNGYSFVIEAGRKFAKIVQTYNGAGRSVHSFVNLATGDLYKPASWRAPVQDMRYNLLRDMELITKVADPYGSYLYKHFPKP